MDKRLLAFKRLLDIMDELREKCPWDKKQTLESLSTLTIEETYELTEAIIEKDYKSLEGEIGDLMLHMVFYAKIGEEKGEFDMSSILNNICEKLIFRHPHIYSDTIVENEDDVKKNWEKLKLKEGRKSVLGGVPKSLPSLVKAERIQDKVKGVGFDWEKRKDVWAKVQEELSELNEAVEENTSKDHIEEEFGDVMFSLINYGRFININTEKALSKTNIKFIKRFKLMEELLINDGLSISDSDLTTMDKYWEKAKKEIINKTV